MTYNEGKNKSELLERLKNSMDARCVCSVECGNYKKLKEIIFILQLICATLIRTKWLLKRAHLVRINVEKEMLGELLNEKECQKPRSDNPDIYCENGEMHRRMMKCNYTISNLLRCVVETSIAYKYMVAYAKTLLCNINCKKLSVIYGDANEKETRTKVLLQLKKIIIRP